MPKKSQITVTTVTMKFYSAATTTKSGHRINAWGNSKSSAIKNLKVMEKSFKGI